MILLLMLHTRDQTELLEKFQKNKFIYQKVIVYEFVLKNSKKWA